MAKYEGVGEFGKLLAGAINSDPRSLTDIAKYLGITEKAIRSHISGLREPRFVTIQIYSIYLNKATSELREMVYRDFKHKNIQDSTFSGELLDFLIRNDLDTQSLSEEIGVSVYSVRKWINGHHPSTNNYVKFIRFAVSYESLIDSKPNKSLEGTYYGS